MFRALAAACMVCLASLTAALPAQAATFIVNGSVTSVTDENLSEGYAPLLAPGARAVANVSIDPNFAGPANIFDSGPNQIAIAFGAAVASALVQSCCVGAEELNPTDGAITVSGLLAGFTGTPVGGYTPSASQFSITFRVAGADIPAAPFATGADVLAFFSAASLSFEGFAQVNFLPQLGQPPFAQRVHFASPVPLPGAAWMFGAGFVAISRLRRRR